MGQRKVQIEMDSNEADLVINQLNQTIGVLQGLLAFENNGMYSGERLRVRLKIYKMQKLREKFMRGMWG